MPWWMRCGESVVVNTDFFNHKVGDHDITDRYVLSPRSTGVKDPGIDDLLVILRKNKGVAIPMRFLDYVEIEK